MTDHAPGLKRRKRADGWARYWMPTAKDIRAGYAPKSIPIPVEASDEEAAEMCRRLWTDLEAWRAGANTQPTRHTISWLIRRYRNDQLSPYRNLRQITSDGYEFALKIIDHDVGERPIEPKLDGHHYRPRLTGEDFRRWHGAWGAPVGPDDAPRPARARLCMVVLRILFSYAIELGIPGAVEQRAVLTAIRLPVRPARQSAPTRAQVLALVKTALDLGYRSIAITTLAQFEFTERRTHIIGCWEGDRWTRGWTWGNISRDWIIRYTQTKVGVVEREFDLRTTPALLEMLEMTPPDRRVGPVIINERTGKPWTSNGYVLAFTKIRKASGVPLDIWSMDMRAGGATEAGSIQGVTSLDVQAAGGWSDSKMASRYTRDRASRAQNVVNIRQAAKSE